MNKSVFKIFHIIGIVIVSLFTAIGLLYVLRGNIFLTAILAIIPATVYAFVVPILEKKKQEDDAFTHEILFGSIYAIIAIVAFFMFFHGINIEFVKKDAIKKAAYDKLETTDQLFLDYEKEVTARLDAFDTEVQTAYSDYKLSPTAQKKTKLESLLGPGELAFNKTRKELDEQVEKGIDEKQIVMKSGRDLSIAKKNWENKRKEKKSVIDNWNRLSISFHYYDIDSIYKDAYAAALVKMPDFKYTPTLKGEDIALDKPIAALGLSSAISIMFLLVFYAFAQGLVLLPYIKQKRFKSPTKEAIREKLEDDYNK
jgi:hypothetical protein